MPNHLNVYEYLASVYQQYLQKNKGKSQTDTNGIPCPHPCPYECVRDNCKNLVNEFEKTNFFKCNCSKQNIAQPRKDCDFHGKTDQNKNFFCIIKIVREVEDYLLDKKMEEFKQMLSDYMRFLESDFAHGEKIFPPYAQLFLFKTNIRKFSNYLKKRDRKM